MKKVWKTIVSVIASALAAGASFTALAAGEVGTDQLQNSIYSFGDYQMCIRDSNHPGWCRTI